MPLELNSLGDPPATPAADQTPSPAPATTPAAPADPAVPAAASRPEWLPEQYWDGDKSAIKDEFGAHFNELATFRQAETDRIAAMKLPEKAEQYPFELPEDFQFPDGITAEDIAIAKDDPEYKAAQQLLFDGKIDPAVGKQLYGLLVKRELRNVEAVNQRIGEEKQKLGPNYADRFKAAETFVAARVGKELGGALMKAVVTADAVKALEKLAASFATQGAPAVTPGRNQDEPAGKIPGYENMTFEEKVLNQRARRASAG